MYAFTGQCSHLFLFGAVPLSGRSHAWWHEGGHVVAFAACRGCPSAAGGLARLDDAPTHKSFRPWGVIRAAKLFDKVLVHLGCLRLITLQAGGPVSSMARPGAHKRTTRLYPTFFLSSSNSFCFCAIKKHQSALVRPPGVSDLRHHLRPCARTPPPPAVQPEMESSSLSAESH